MRPPCDICVELERNGIHDVPCSVCDDTAPPLDEHAIEERTAEQIVKLLLDNGVINDLMADQIRSGAWRKP